MTDQSGPGETPETTPPQDPLEAIVHDAEVLDELPVFEDEASTAPTEIELLRTERDEYLDHLRRLQAEFDNFRKRMLREQTVLVERANESLIEQLLPVLDAFEMAIASAASASASASAAAGAGTGGSDPERLRKGVELVYNELNGVLSKSGLERIEATGKPFDPEEHEAVMHVEAGEGETGVLDVVRAGYRLKGRVLRPAMVKVAT